PARVYRRTDAWRPVNNEGLFASATAALNVTGVATSAVDSSAVYALDFAGRMLKSSTHGTAWNAPPPSLHTQLLRAVAVDPFFANVAYVATDEGAWRTIDGGFSWQRSAGISVPIEKIVVSPSNRQVIYASSVWNTSLFRSNDGGLNFTETASLPATGKIGALAVDPANAQVVYAIVHNFLAKSTDGGGTWTMLPARDSTGADYNIGPAVLIDPVHPTTLTIPSNAQHRGFIRSVDGGATWVRTTLNIGGNISYATAGVLHPTQPTLLVAAYEDQGVGEYEVATDLAFAFTVQNAFAGSPFPAGHSAPMTILVMNAGPHAASPSTLRVTLPAWLSGAATAGCSYAPPVLTCPLAPIQIGETRPITLTLAADSGSQTGTIQGSLTTHERDLNPASNLFAFDVAATFQSDLRIAASPDTSVLVGAAISRTLTVTNVGPSESVTNTLATTSSPNLAVLTATSSRGTCSINAGSFGCQLGAMASGESATITFTGNASIAGEADIFATVLTSNDDRNPLDNVVRVRTTITSPPPPPPPPPPPKRGGGGGSLDWLAALFLGWLVARRSRLRVSARR
ncbi:MAG TPA: hypothetical protein VIV63_10495, partial [Steroidobacteraceae bacterium]